MSPINDQEGDSGVKESEQGSRLKFECHGFECVSKGLHAMLAVGVLLELVSGNSVFRAGPFDHMWMHDALAVTLVLAIAFQWRWWSGVRASSIGWGSKLSQGLGVIAVSLLCLTGFLGVLFGVFDQGGAVRLFAEDLTAHHYLVYGVWLYLASHLIFTMAQQFNANPVFAGQNGRRRGGL
ncbi:hypothetical protein BI364_15180 [Acidihalobacter yilgarnensis]|uniref:Cytochrome b561 bacterial/Ni-hydrogenase domain-containing protein n=1 Tax=Acidihalobacter yilgarnensis TaxID=2819280 RepID=A0A1D8IRH8_9GAMM|nr:hypothetical protein [Acidihalobacter yilgarnensis]AOU99102.1 hypothetical protein BI364_15180 [Acidihalobacter yilgarnensis]